MARWNNPFKSKTRRAAERDLQRGLALGRSRSAVRRERRALAKRQSKADELRQKAVEFERQGQPHLAKQSVRRFIQIDREVIARTLALNNMEYALEQVQVKDNYEAFTLGMKLVADLEDLARQAIDPDAVRARITEMIAHNHDVIEPWSDEMTGEPMNLPAHTQLTEEESQAYQQVVSEAAGAVESVGREFAGIDAELERKMDAALTKE